MKQEIDQKEIAGRINAVIDYYQISDSMFAKKVGIDTGNFNKKVKGKQNWTIFDINKICEKTEVSRMWLLQGEGEMIRTDDNGGDDIKMVGLPSDFDNVTRPRLPVTATAGHLTEYIDGVMMYHCEQMPVIKRFPDYDFTMFIRGNSMEPKYEGGDEIALKKATIIEWGKDYILDTDDGPIFKKIYEDGDNIRCVSYNYDEYPDFLVPKSSVHGYFRFIGLIRV